MTFASRSMGAAFLLGRQTKTAEKKARMEAKNAVIRSMNVIMSDVILELRWV